MRTALGRLTAALLLTLSLAITVFGQGVDGATRVVQGDVLNIEGSEYVLKDMTGHEIRLRVDASTRLRDRIKVGDKVEAQTTADGRAVSIRVKLPDDGPVGGMGPAQAVP
jgi:translation initiation factor IF-1